MDSIGTETMVFIDLRNWKGTRKSAHMGARMNVQDKDDREDKIVGSISRFQIGVQRDQGKMEVSGRGKDQDRMKDREVFLPAENRSNRPYQNGM